MQSRLTWLDTPTIFCSHDQSWPLPMKLLPKHSALILLVASRAGNGMPLDVVQAKIRGACGTGSVTARLYKTRVPANNAWLPADKTLVKITWKMTWAIRWVEYLWFALAVFMKEPATSVEEHQLLLGKWQLEHKRTWTNFFEYNGKWWGRGCFVGQARVIPWNWKKVRNRIIQKGASNTNRPVQWARCSRYKTTEFWKLDQHRYAVKMGCTHLQKTNLTTRGMFFDGFLVSPAVIPRLSVPPSEKELSEASYVNRLIWTHKQNSP